MKWRPTSRTLMNATSIRAVPRFSEPSTQEPAVAKTSSSQMTVVRWRSIDSIEAYRRKYNNGNSTIHSMSTMCQ